MITSYLPNTFEGAKLYGRIQVHKIIEAYGMEVNTLASSNDRRSQVRAHPLLTAKLAAPTQL